MVLDHYVTQTLTGHNDVKGKLHQFPLNANATVRARLLLTVVYNCRRVKGPRSKLKATVNNSGLK